jgi:hypothetical protein
MHHKTDDLLGTTDRYAFAILNKSPPLTSLCWRESIMVAANHPQAKVSRMKKVSVTLAVTCSFLLVFLFTFVQQLPLVAAAKQPGNITTLPSNYVTGTVKDAATNVPLSSIAVFAYSPDGTAQETHFGVTDASGN